MDYANKYMREEGLVTKTPISTSPEKLRSDYQNDSIHKAHAVSKFSLDSVREQGHNEIKQDVSQRGSALRNNVKDEMDNQSTTIVDTASTINQEGAIVKNSVTSQQGRYVTRRLAEKGIDEVKGIKNDAYQIYSEYKNSRNKSEH